MPQPDCVQRSWEELKEKNAERGKKVRGCLCPCAFASPPLYLLRTVRAFPGERQESIPSQKFCSIEKKNNSLVSCRRSFGWMFVVFLSLVIFCFGFVELSSGTTPAVVAG